jgi:CO/xanthine dehydrogenase Mo-binding subunit
VLHRYTFLYIARDAAEAVFADIDPLPAVTSASEAAAAEAPLLHDEAPGNVCMDFHSGDSEKVAVAFAQAAHVNVARRARPRGRAKSSRSV